jgi:hypothetical protein
VLVLADRDQYLTAVLKTFGGIKSKIFVYNDTNKEPLTGPQLIKEQAKENP